MNLKDLIAKMDSIEEGTEIQTDECGAMPSAVISAGPQGQQDNVSMSVNVQGQGEGGLRSIMNILRDIEKGEQHSDHDQHGHDEPIMGMDMEGQSDDSPLTTAPNDIGVEEQQAGDEGDDQEEWGNSAHGGSAHHTHGIEAVTFSGDDLNSKGKSSPVMRAPGTNTLREPTNVSEELVSRLSQMYQAIKEERTEEKNEKGEVTKWKEETPWRKATNKDGRGKVTNMSDKARRESEKMAEKETEVDESAKWRDPKYKGQLFTQKKGDSDDYDHIDYGYGMKERPKKDPGQKRSTFDRDTVWTDPLDTRSNLHKDHNDPETWGHGSISGKGSTKGKITADRRKHMKNNIQGSLGQHHTPNLPEQTVKFRRS